MDGLIQDIRFAARGLRRDRGFTTFVVVALTLGIGANAAMFGIVDRLLLSGPPYVTDAARVVRVYLSGVVDGSRPFTTSSFGNVSYDVARRDARTFDGIASYAVNSVVIGQGVDAHSAPVGYASDTLFTVLGVPPSLGRFFGPDDNRPAGALRVAVLGDAAWQRWYGGDRGVVGRQVTIGGASYVIIGVAPRGFVGPQDGPVDAWVPINLLGPGVVADWTSSWTAQWLHLVGRLKPGVTFAQASADLTTIHQRAYTGTESAIATGRLFVAPLSADSRGADGQELTVVRWLSGVALVVLGIACANVGNLLLARGLRRSREVALRAALGAGKAQLVRLLLAESLLLALAGAAGGVALAYALGGVARTTIFSRVDWTTSPVDLRVLVVSAALSVATGLVIGLLPAWRATRVNLTDALKQGMRDGGGDRSRVRQFLTVAQAALSVVLLIGAGLFVRSLWNVRALHLGVDLDRVVLAQISRAPLGQIAGNDARTAERARRADVERASLAAVRQIPGVEHASLAAGTPFGNRFGVEIRIPGVPTVPTLSTGGPSISAVADDYFTTMGTRILRGREFGSGDHAGTEPVAVVSDTMARTIWPQDDAIGKCIVVETSPCARIVGIAEDTRRSLLREAPVMHFYIPLGQEVGFGGTVLITRAAPAAGRLDAVIKQTLAGMDPTIRFVSFQTLQHAVDPQVEPWRIGATVFVLSGLLALIVAAIGIYSVMSYFVADRAHEIGVRLALGAQRGDVTRLIVRGGVALSCVGIAAGSVIAAGAGHFIEPLLFDESSHDPLVYGVVAGVLLVVASCAAVVPAIRASRVGTLGALRGD